MWRRSRWLRTSASGSGSFVRNRDDRSRRLSTRSSLVWRRSGRLRASTSSFSRSRDGSRVRRLSTRRPALVWRRPGWLRASTGRSGSFARNRECHRGRRRSAMGANCYGGSPTLWHRRGRSLRRGPCGRGGSTRQGWRRRNCARAVCCSIGRGDSSEPGWANAGIVGHNHRCNGFRR